MKLGQISSHFSIHTFCTCQNSPISLGMLLPASCRHTSTSTALTFPLGKGACKPGHCCKKQQQQGRKRSSKKQPDVLMRTSRGHCCMLENNSRADVPGAIFAVKHSFLQCGFSSLLLVSHLGSSTPRRAADRVGLQQPFLFSAQGDFSGCTTYFLTSKLQTPQLPPAMRANTCRPPGGFGSPAQVSLR